MLGYYFPFSMEANYNKVAYVTNLPVTMCHELAHLKGYIQEDEANFIGFLACISSDDLLFQYSGYLSVLNYVNNDFMKLLGKIMKSIWQRCRLTGRCMKTQCLCVKRIGTGLKRSGRGYGSSRCCVHRVCGNFFKIKRRRRRNGRLQPCSGSFITMVLSIVMPTDSGA